MKHKRFGLILLGLLASAITAYGHHSFASTYFEDKTTKIEGEILQFEFRNPHSFITVLAPDEKGVMQRWGVEWGGATQLAGQGITARTFRAGDLVTITGRPGRTESDHRILMQTFRRKSDGLGWGTRPGEVVD